MKPMDSIDLNDVTEKVRHILEQVGLNILSLRSEGDLSLEYKNGNEVVSAADKACQDFLKTHLSAIFSDAIFVMEEDKEDKILASMDAAKTALWTWIIDPIDGTSNYVAGRSDFGIQVALANRGDLVAAWIHCPVDKKSAYGHINGPLKTENLAIPPDRHNSDISQMNIVVASGDFEKDHKAACSLKAQAARSARGTSSCAVDYLELLEQKVDFLIYRRTRPWDHAPGATLINLAGGCIERFNGAAYKPFDQGEGMVACRGSSSLVWARDFAP
jgi:fructose-1,6-bisphosphatase/inositol monophosphatase family enzyme